MKNLKLLSVMILLLAVLSAFNTNSKLTQAGAEKAIREFVQFSTTSALAPKLRILEVLNIDPVNQSSENKASCRITAKGKVENSGSDSVAIACTYIETKLTIGFRFEKKADNNWILTGIDKFASKVRVSGEYLQAFQKQNSTLHIAVK